MVIVKASRASEAGEMPSTELLTATGNYNEELVRAGIMLAGAFRKELMSWLTSNKLGQLDSYDGLKAYVARACDRPAFQKALRDQLAHFAAADVVKKSA
jgi:glutathione S-transferase